MPCLPVMTALSPWEREGAAKLRKGEGDRLRTYHNRPSGTVSRARELRRNATDAEKALWRGLREHLPQAKFRRQVPVGAYFADFYSFSARLIIEVDGGQHDEAQSYDAARTRFLESQGYRVIRFWNNDVLTNIEGVLGTIAENLSPSPSHAVRGPLPLPLGEGNTE
jgi:very-short-patch-repair endonuclease